jgi:hypothetical protein
VRLGQRRSHARATHLTADRTNGGLNAVGCHTVARLRLARQYPTGCPVSELLPRTNTAEPAEVAEQFVSVFASSEETNQGYAASEIGEGQ